MIIKTRSFLMKCVAYLLPIVWLAAIGVSLVEAYFYPGFFLKHTFIDPLFIYLAFGILSLFWQFGYNPGSNKFVRLFQKLNLFTIYIFGFGYIFINLVESFKYPNYVFSTFHVQPKQLAPLVTFSVYTGIIFSKDIFLANIKDLRTLFKSKLPIIVFLFWIIVNGIVDIGTGAIQNLSFMVRNPLASYDQKMEEKIGKQFYDYTLFIKKNTPENSRILIPPFPTYPWIQTGNAAYLRYFLYPRSLLNGEEYSPKYDLKKENIDYILLAWGEVPVELDSHVHGWPKFDVEAEKIIYMINDKEKREEKGNYVYKNVENKELWGVIKVKK